MYNPNVVKDRIKARAAHLGISMRDLTLSCGIGINAISQLGKPYCKSLSSDTLYAIAELLECSVDYLLGREELLTPDQCVDIIDSIIAGKSKAELVAKYGGDLERSWNAMLVCAHMVKREEALR